MVAALEAGTTGLVQWCQCELAAAAEATRAAAVFAVPLSCQLIELGGCAGASAKGDMWSMIQPVLYKLLLLLLLLLCRCNWNA
jgi:hypothetical protein